MALRLSEEELAKLLKSGGVSEDTTVNTRLPVNKVQQVNKPTPPKNKAEPISFDIDGAVEKFDSKTEGRAYMEIPIWWGEYKQRFNKRIGLYLPGFVHYRPDIGIIDMNGRLNFIEVKGSFAAYQSGRDASTRIAVASDYFHWMAEFYLLTVPKGRDKWLLEHVIDINNRKVVYRG